MHAHAPQLARSDTQVRLYLWLKHFPPLACGLPVGASPCFGIFLSVFLKRNFPQVLNITPKAAKVEIVSVDGTPVGYLAPSF
jgi:hypothetical protein